MRGKEERRKAARLWWAHGRTEVGGTSRCRGGAPRDRPRPDSRGGTRGPPGKQRRLRPSVSAGDVHL
eukprot:3057277-Pleurochrysis_carterae.AAC.1